MYASRYKFVSPLGYLSFAMRAIVSRSIVWQYKIWTFCFDVILPLVYIPSHIFILLGCFIDKIYRSNAFRFFTQLDRQNACYENTKSCWSIVIPVGKEKKIERNDKYILFPFFICFCLVNIYVISKRKKIPKCTWL